MDGQILDCHIVFNCGVVLTSEDKNNFTGKTSCAGRESVENNNAQFGEGGAHIGCPFIAAFHLATLGNRTCVDTPTQVRTVVLLRFCREFTESLQIANKIIAPGQEDKHDMR